MLLTATMTASNSTVYSHIPSYFSKIATWLMNPSTILAIIPIIISVLTLLQNNKMIEESTRPVISVYTQRIYYNNRSSLYLVVKNFGSSTAYMTKFTAEPNLNDCYGFQAPRNYIDDLNSCVIAPNQSRICYLEYKALPEKVKFSLEYHSNAKRKKKYVDEITIDLKAATSMPMEGPSQDMNHSARIASALESILFKDL